MTDKGKEQEASKASKGMAKVIFVMVALIVLIAGIIWASAA